MNLWLTRIRPDLRHKDARREVGNFVALHKRTMELLPNGLGDTPRSEAGVLFRVDEDRDGVVILMQSRIEPLVEKLPGGYGDIAVKPLASFMAQLLSGRRVNYRLAGNAAKRISRPNDKPGYRPPSSGKGSPTPGQTVTLTGTEAEEWWTSRASAAGLRIVTTASRPLDTVTGSGKGGSYIKYPRHLFEGTAVITDPDALRSAMVSGIGRGKSYGCGLLSLVPAR